MKKKNPIQSLNTKFKNHQNKRKKQLKKIDKKLKDLEKITDNLYEKLEKKKSN